MYVVLVIWCLVCGVIRKMLSQRFKKKSCDIVFMILFWGFCSVIMGFRDASVGVDTQHYKDIFEAVMKIPFIAVISGQTGYVVDPFYLILMKLSSLIIPSYYGFQIFISFLYCFGMGYFFLKKENIFLSAVLFLGLDMFLIPMKIQRQAISMMLAANAWNCIYGSDSEMVLYGFLEHSDILHGILKKKSNYYIFKQTNKVEKKHLVWGGMLFVLALCFHSSAVIVVLAQLINLFRNDKKKLFICMIGVIVGGGHLQV